MRVSKTDREEAIAELRKTLKPGDTVYGVVRHVSRSGMSRNIDLYVIRNNTPVYLTGYASKVLDYSLAKHDRGMVDGGCGMDMVFHCVYSLAGVLFANSVDKGYALRSEAL